MADERAAYPDSSRRSEQLSCTKFFHPSYGLFYMNFKRFKLILAVFADVSMTSAVNRSVDWVADVWDPLVIDCLA